jgi:hypothetical protein
MVKISAENVFHKLHKIEYLSHANAELLKWFLYIKKSGKVASNLLSMHFLREAKLLNFKSGVAFYLATASSDFKSKNIKRTIASIIYKSEAFK